MKLIARVAAVLLAVTCAFLPTAASAGTIIDRAAAELRGSPLYVDPDAASALDAQAQQDIRQRLEQSSTPIYVAVLPTTVTSEAPGGNRDRVPQALYQALGRRGTY